MLSSLGSTFLDSGNWSESNLVLNELPLDSVGEEGGAAVVLRAVCNTMSRLAFF